MIVAVIAACLGCEVELRVDARRFLPGRLNEQVAHVLQLSGWSTLWGNWLCPECVRVGRPCLSCPWKPEGGPPDGLNCAACTQAKTNLCWRSDVV